MAPRYSQELIEAVWAGYGKERARVLAERHGINLSGVLRIWQHERKRRNVLSPYLPYPHDLIERVWSEYGKTPAATVAEQCGLGRRTVIRIWRRQRVKLGLPPIATRLMPISPRQYSCATARTPEIIEQIWALYGKVRARDIYEQFGFKSYKAVHSIWERERKRRGVPALIFPRHTPELIASVWGEYGNAMAADVATKFGLRNAQAVLNIWGAQRKALGVEPIRGTCLSQAGPRRIRSTYTREFIDTIFAGWGQVSSVILAERHGISKNAVIGIWGRERARLGIKIVRAARPIVCRPNPTHRPRTAMSVGRSLGPKWPSLRLVVSNPPKTATPICDGLGAALLDLPNNGCRYCISGESISEYRFCGDTVFDRSFCAAHYQLCYVPPKRRDLERLAA